MFSAVYVLDGVLYDVKMNKEKENLINLINKQHQEGMFRLDETVIQIWDENSNVVFDYEKDLWNKKH